LYLIVVKLSSSQLKAFQVGILLFVLN